ncbi:hypothetical protein [Pedobacter sp. Leaf132]|uniref:hypothetical protein n=1 Tax=Pedobacter sp. Leaf132 TaxID=2876557 RepID=UPI001E3CEB13|nr:hypothetical protein [Pedobacter sp. Leaf132]
MDNFKISVEEGDYTVEPQENGTYRIMQDDHKLGVIYAEAVDEHMQWRTMDEFDDALVLHLGEAITKHNDNQEV